MSIRDSINTSITNIASDIASMIKSRAKSTLSNISDEGIAYIKELAETNVTDITLTSSDWEGGYAPYSQIVTVEGMTEDINPHASLVASGDYYTAQSEREEFAKVYKGVSGDGIITFYATSPTDIDITIRIKGV